MSQIPRRSFIVSASGALAALAASNTARANKPFATGALTPASSQPESLRRWAEHRGPCVIASGNGITATQRAWEVMSAGADPIDAVVQGVTLVENDPNDNSVGYGGLPNEDGVVQLDASVMHGPTHKAGAVACLEGIKNPSQVALLVLKTTDHILLVGEGAKRFALRHGFTEENLLTEASRKAWLRWKSGLSPTDDWLDPDQMDFQVAGLNAPNAIDATDANGPGAQALGSSGGPGLQPGSSGGPDLQPGFRGRDFQTGIAPLGPIPYTTGTINCSALNSASNLGSCTTTSGLSWKIPGRVGDSPIVGAGMYVDNAVGAAGSTGRGEAVIANCGAFNIVREMESGKTPTEACLAVLKRIADKTLEHRNRDERGRPNFNVSFYALRKDGAYGSACMLPGGSFCVHDGTENRTWACPSLFE